jgi:hypothetical protein
LIPPPRRPVLLITHGIGGDQVLIDIKILVHDVGIVHVSQSRRRVHPERNFASDIMSL